MTTSLSGATATGRSAIALDRSALLVALGAITISSSAIFIVLSGASAVATAFYRSIIALPLLIVLAAVEYRRDGSRPLSQHVKVVTAGVFLAADLITWTHAIIDVGAGVATVLGNLQVLFVAGISWLIWKERPHWAVAAAIPAVMLGVVLVSGLLGGHASGLHPFAGVLYGLATAVTYSIFLLILRRSTVGSAQVAGPVMDATAGAAITALVYGLIFGGLSLRPLWPAIGWLAIYALVAQVAGWLLITSSLPHLPAALGSLLLLLQPTAALVLAAVILGQRPTFLQVLGAVLTCGGALAASVAAARPSGHAEAPATAAGEPAATPEPAETPESPGPGDAAPLLD